MLLFFMIGLNNGAVFANQTPSSSTGTGPVTKTFPGGTTMQTTLSGTRAVIFDDSIALNAIGGVTSVQLSPAISATTDSIEIDVNPTGCTTSPLETLRCANRGVLTLTFSNAVTNPIIHISGLGANQSSTTFFHSSLVMTGWTATAKPTFTLTNGNGNLSVSGDEIRSTTINGQTSCTTTNKSGCGSVRMNGTITSVTFQIDLLMGGTGSATNVDGWDFTVSLDEDFGDAPGSYDPTAAASHIIGGYYLGAGVSVENAGTTNVLGTPITPSPIANATDGGVLDTDGLVNGVIRLAITPPSGTTQVTTISRFRWSPTAGVGPTTRGTVGEVEDYEVTVYPQRADLSLTKLVSNAAPSWGSTITYTLRVTNAASPTSTVTATGITVQDTLPAGFTYASQSGTGSYNSGTGVWTVGSLAPGAFAEIVLTGTVSATTGTVANIAQIRASSATDPDSTPNNGVTTEDDYATVSFTVASVLAAPTCTAGGTNQIISNGTFATGTGPSWTSWTAGAVWFGTGVAAVDNDTTGGTLSQSGLSGLKFGPSGAGGAVIQLSQWWRNGSPAASSAGATLTISLGGTNYAVITTPTGAGTSATVTYLNGASGNLTSLTEFVTTGWRINIPTTANATGALSFAYAPGGGTLDDDFEVDNVTLYTCTPGQLSVTKISNVVTDYVSAAEPKSIPGALVRYCILVTNTGTVTASNVSVSDPLPSEVTYVSTSLLSGTSCGTAATSEDENATDGDETDPYGMSISGTTITGTAATLAPSDSFVMVFNAIVD